MLVDSAFKISRSIIWIVVKQFLSLHPLFESRTLFKASIRAIFFIFTYIFFWQSRVQESVWVCFFSDFHRHTRYPFNRIYRAHFCLIYFDLWLGEFFLFCYFSFFFSSVLCSAGNISWIREFILGFYFLFFCLLFFCLFNFSVIFFELSLILSYLVNLIYSKGFGSFSRYKINLQRRVWSWLRMNASDRPNTCKSRGSTWGSNTDGGDRRTGE